MGLSRVRVRRAPRQEEPEIKTAFTIRPGIATASIMLALGALFLLLASAPAALAQEGQSEEQGAGQTASTCEVSPRPEADDPDPLRGVCDYLEGREGVVQVALFNKGTGRSYRLSTGDDKQLTASIVKVDILAKWLRDLEKQGAEIPGDIPYSIRYLMQRMIENSDNAAATSLFHFGGGCDALTRFNTLIPLRATKVGCESSTYYGWGNTETTAADQVRLMKLFAYGTPRGILGSDARSYGRQLLQAVEPDQRFGITCGPWGSSCGPPDYASPDPDVTVALKNGWKTLPNCSQPIEQCPWQVNSTGWVRGKGRDYVLTVLTTRDPVGTGGTYGFDYGIDTIQNVSQRVWDNVEATPVPTPDDRTVEGSASAKKTQRQKGKRIAVKARVRAREALTAKATGTIKVGKRSYKLTPQTARVSKGERKTLTIKSKRRAGARKVFRALRRGKTARAKLMVNLADQEGNAESQKLVVRLTR